MYFNRYRKTVDFGKNAHVINTKAIARIIFFTATENNYMFIHKYITIIEYIFTIIISFY